MNPLDPEQDEVTRISAHDVEGLENLETLFREHHTRIYRAAYRVTGNGTDAEDVLQTIFLRLMKRPGEVLLGPTVGSYLYRAAVNAALDLLRSKGRARAVGLDDACEDVENVGVEMRNEAETRIEDRELRASLRAFEVDAEVRGSLLDVFA